jgi:CHAT domain-containing protein/tetratricopeptide (TPR) repeat protein
MKYFYIVIAWICFLYSCQQTPISTPAPNYNQQINDAFKSNNLEALFDLKQIVEKTIFKDTLALIYRRIGSVYNNRQQPDSAIANTEFAINMLQSLPKTNLYFSDIAKCQYNLGSYHLYQETNLKAARQYLQTALPIFEQLKDTLSIFHAQKSLLVWSVQTKDYVQAELITIHNQQFINKYSFSNDALRDWYSTVALKACNQLEEDSTQQFKLQKDALHAYEQCLKYQTDSQQIAATWLDIGRMHLHVHDTSEARTVFEKTLKLLRMVHDTLNEAKCLNNLSLCYAPTQAAIARELLLSAEKKLITLYKNKPHIDRARTYSYLGDLDFEQKNYLNAINRYEQAIENACFGKKEVEKLLWGHRKLHFDLTEPLLYPLKRKAEAHFQQFLIDNSQQNLLKSLKMFEMLDEYIAYTRGLIQSDESKFEYAAQTISIYEQALTVAMTVYRQNPTMIDPILRFMAHSKAAVLQEAAQQDSAKQYAHVPETLLQQEKSLKWAVAQSQKRVLEVPEQDSAKQNLAYRALLKARQSWERFTQSLENQYPAYYELKYASLKPLKIKDLQMRLAKNRAVIDYFWGQQSLYTVVITQNKFEIYNTLITPLLQQSIHEYVHALRAGVVNDTVGQVLSKYSFNLYQQLLEKPLQMVNADGKMTRLTILPDGILSYLPFDALTQMPVNDWLKRDTTAFLVWKYAISYAYSNTLLFGQPNLKKTVAPIDFGGFGIGYQRDKYANESNNKKAGGILRNAETDVRNSKRHFQQSKIWTEQDDNATLESFYANAPDCRILYLSMHGVLNDSLPLHSSLVFVKKDSLQLLQLADIQGLHLPNNDLTVLSACNTGLGKLSKGEGLISLSRAFSFIGTRCLVTSLWSLYENASSVIIERFFQYIKHDVSKDIALQKAKQDYLKTHQADELMPNYWAATVLIGDIEPVSMPAKMNQDWWWVGFACVVIGFWGYKIKFASKNAL